ncbi:MAG TPA: hypothetical protein VHV27_02565 [Phenylobacterium sp.]|jgi:hypothetical protein|nr:hypothetical protein [Phenylobacterium sp.]
MEQSSDTPLETRPRAPEAVKGRLKQAGRDAVVWLHRQADRMDLLPSEFGDKAPVDPADADSLLREWLRQLRLWADYSPEQVLALKVGLAALGVAMLVLVVLVAAVR